MSVKSRREMYAEATREAILEAAAALFAEHGYAGTSVEDVATTSQVTRGAVYHHFAGKKALFEAVLEGQETRAMDEIAAAATDPDPWEAALRALDVYLEKCCDATYSRLVWVEGPAALGWSHFRQCEEKYAYALVESFVHTLIESGHLERSRTENTVWYLFWFCGGAGLRLAETPESDKARVRDESSHLFRQVMKALRTA